MTTDLRFVLDRLIESNGGLLDSLLIEHRVTCGNRADCPTEKWVTDSQEAVRQLLAEQDAIGRLIRGETDVLLADTPLLKTFAELIRMSDAQKQRIKELEAALTNNTVAAQSYLDLKAELADVVQTLRTCEQDNLRQSAEADKFFKQAQDLAVERDTAYTKGTVEMHQEMMEIAGRSEKHWQNRLAAAEGVVAAARRVEVVYHDPILVEALAAYDATGPSTGSPGAPGGPQAGESSADQ